MRYAKTIIKGTVVLFILAALLSAAHGDEDRLFSTSGKKEFFARDVSDIIGKAWIKWQDAVRIDNVYVDGSQGTLFPGDLRGGAVTMPLIFEGFEREGRSQDYIDCVRAVAEALENGMRLWQRGYSHDNIPFPQGASCVYTLPPCKNVPVLVGEGRSAGDASMAEEELFNFMLYRIPYRDDNVVLVLRGAARAINGSFEEWKEECFITDITASGGIAPQPAPIGQGPGMVKGAKGNGGRLTGAYFDGERMYERMMGSLRE